MNRTSRFTVALLCAAALVSSCKKGRKPDGDPEVTTAVKNATVLVRTDGPQQSAPARPELPEVEAPDSRCDPSTTVTAEMIVTADDHRTVFLNGEPIERSKDQWMTPGRFRAQIRIHPSRKNVLAIISTNVQSQDGRDRGLVFELAAKTPKGIFHLISDSTWRVSPVSDSSGTPEWAGLEFDDSRWSAATDMGPNGIPPWNRVLGDSSAHWIWSYDANRPVGTKVNVETVGFRRVFSLDCGPLERR